MSLKKSISFIVNPIAGGKNKKYLVRYLQDHLDKEVFSFRILFSNGPHHAYELSRKEIKGGADILVAVGGDGTINEVAKAILGSGKILGIIPFGSGNGIARHLGIPSNFKRAIDIIVNNSGPTSIDIGYVNEKPFFGTSGIGYDADIAHLFMNSKHRGLPAYIRRVLRTFLVYQPVAYSLVIDGEKHETEAFLINIANISQFGNRFQIAPGASVVDGLLDITIVRKFPRYQAPLLLLMSFLGTIQKSRYVYHQKVREVTLFLPEGEKKLHLDGEPLCIMGKVTFRIEPKRMRIIIP